MTYPAQASRLRRDVDGASLGRVYPSPETVQNLGLKLLQTAGGGAGLARSPGVTAEKRERVLRMFDETVSKRALILEEEPYETYQVFNSSHCDSAPQLRDCFSRNSDVLYGTLSHSHLLL